MRNKLLNIFLSIFLTLAVTDYIWVEIFHKQQVVAEVETEKEQETEEEFREGRTSEKKQDSLDSNGLVQEYNYQSQNISTGFVKHGNSYRPLAKRNNPKIFILHQQLRLHC